MEILGTFIAVFAALELNKYLNGKRPIIKKKLIQRKRKVKKWWREKFK